MVLSQNLTVVFDCIMKFQAVLLMIGYCVIVTQTLLFIHTAV